MGSLTGGPRYYSTLWERRGKEKGVSGRAEPRAFVLSAQHHIDAGEDEFQFGAREPADTFRQKFSIHGDDLRHIGDRVFGAARSHKEVEELIRPP